ncbi:MAG TPA: hypothetical protein VH370_04140 [Humisphaera sp.]|nr:hypothetical protein [Humisphaera sp.]
MYRWLSARAGLIADRLADQRGAAWPKTTAAPELIEELRHAVGLLSQESEGGGQREEFWNSSLRELRDLIQHDDPSRFLRWPVIAKTMFVNNSLTSLRQWRWLKRSAQRARWLGALEENSIGDPKPFLLNTRTSGNQINHTYHLAQFEDKTHRSVSEARLILEFGGGYGSMCRQAHKLGFRGRYIIFDLPEFSCLQRFYLKAIGLPVAAGISDAGQNAIALVSNLADLRQTLNLVSAELSPRMFIATWSLSEVPVELRREIWPLIERFDSYLVGYQTAFGSTSNTEYFGQWVRDNPTVKWNNYLVPAIRRFNWYLMGTR